MDRQKRVLVGRRRVESAEQAVVRLAAEAKANVNRIGSRSVLLQSALRVILAHNLLDEFAAAVAEADAVAAAELAANNGLPPA